MSNPRERNTNDHSELHKFQASLAELETRSRPQIHPQVQTAPKTPRDLHNTRTQLRIEDLLNPESGEENGQTQH